MGRGRRWWRRSPFAPFARGRRDEVRAVAGVADPSQSALLRCAPPVRFQRVSSVRFACPQDRPSHPQLSKAGAAYVDAQLVDRVGSCGWRAIESAVAQAIASYDPQLLETREQQGKAAWGVRLYHRDDGQWAGTSHLDVTGDTLDLTVFHDLVCDQAAQLKALGDTDTLDVRKAKAVGVIANRQASLDLGAMLGAVTGRACPGCAAGGQDQAVPAPDAERPARPRPRRRRWRRGCRVRDGGEVRAGHRRPDQGLGRQVPGHHPTRPGHGP